MYDHKALLVVCWNLSAAFDTIDHTLLVNHKQNYNGLCGKAFDWLKSDLTDRYRSVHIKHSSSESNFGIPRGSVLGHLLFSYYTKLIRAIAAKYNLKIHLYADDTRIRIQIFNCMCLFDFQATQKQSLHYVLLKLTSIKHRYG